MSTIYKRLRTNELASINKDAFENRNSRLHITLKHFSAEMITKLMPINFKVNIRMIHNRLERTQVCQNNEALKQWSSRKDGSYNLINTRTTSI